MQDCYLYSLQGSNDVYEFLSGVPITPMTSFLDLTRDDVMREYRTVVHYMRYALAAYGWPMYMMMNTGTGLCRILPRLRSVACLVLFCATSKPIVTQLVYNNYNNQRTDGHSIEYITHASHSIAFCTLWP